jgi:hypothetical protein
MKSSLHLKKFTIAFLLATTTTSTQSSFFFIFKCKVIFHRAIFYIYLYITKKKQEKTELRFGILYLRFVCSITKQNI